jgi:magnesium chelatase family protein
LAHHGVLFLDELPEFNRNVLEVLREPMESGRIIISRAARQAEFPARFQLVAAMNPCPCGYHGDRTKDCKCSGEQVSRYRNKVSGPLLDRIDLFVEVARPKQIVIPGTGQPGEPSTAVRERVVAAHSIQIERQGVANARLEASGMKRHCRLRAEDESFVANAAQQLSLSPRGCQRVLKVARTIADLDGAKNIEQNHLAEAIGFRQPGRY